MQLIPQKICSGLLLAALLIWSTFLRAPGICNADTNENYFIKEVQLTASPYRILIRLNRRPAYKVVQIDRKEIVIALKNVSFSDGFRKKGTAKPLINKIKFESHQNNTVALVINTTKDVRDVQAEWEKQTNTLAVRFKRQPVAHKVRANLKRKSRSKARIAPEVNRVVSEGKMAEETLPIPEKRSAGKSKLKGSIDDILEIMMSDICGREEPVKNAIELCRKAYWDEATTLLEQLIQSGGDTECIENIYFLKGYAEFKNSGGRDTTEIIDVVNYVQGITTRFPDSKYMPYIMSILGKLYIQLGNETEAKGYFKIVLDKYAYYSGIPEILFDLALLDIRKKEYKNAILLYKKILSDYPEYILRSDVRLELGKAYFATNNFSKTIQALNQVREENPRKIYESSDLLLFIGNSYYHTGKYTQARGILNEVYNLYPDMPTAHMVLTRIGDILVDENQVEKAKKIFTLVTEKYPGTDGYIISSVRLAKFQENRDEKEKIYEKIINDYPEHPMANLARLRLAEIEYNAGEFERSISSINDLLLENPRALIREAIFLKKQAFKSLFETLMSGNNYPGILAAYEKDRNAINRFDETPEIFLLVGKAYYLGYLYTQAARLLEKAYKNYEDRKKPGELLFMLGVSLHESGKIEDALKYYAEYLKEYPKGKEIAETYRRIGRIQSTRGMEREAVASYDKALRRSSQNTEKAEILCEYGRYKLKTKDYKKSVAFLNEGIRLLKKSPGDHTALLLQAYRNLGEAEMRLKSYSKAALAFSNAIERTKNEEDRVGLNYLLGESYHKSNEYKKAAEIYKNVVGSGDAFWGKLAEERLKGIALAAKLN